MHALFSGLLHGNCAHTNKDFTHAFVSLNHNRQTLIAAMEQPQSLVHTYVYKMSYMSVLLYNMHVASAWHMHILLDHIQLPGTMTPTVAVVIPSYIIA